MSVKSSLPVLAPATSGNSKTFNLATSVAFLRQGFLPFEEANISIASSPVLYGLAVYTVFNVIVVKGKLIIFRLDDHYNRLRKSASIMGFTDWEKEWPYTVFKSRMIELIKQNDLRSNALVRVSLFIDELAAGTRIDGLKVSLSAFVYPMAELLPLSGAHLCVSSWIRTADSSMPARAKINGSYVNASLMKNEALINGYDDAIAIDHAGHVTESSVANVFIVREGKLITPPTFSDILEGITRDTVLSLAEDLDIKVEERQVDRSELYIADEVFLSGSSANITPVLSIDRRLVGAGRIGPITKDLSDLYRRTQTGLNSVRSHWCLAIDDKL